MSKYFEAAEAIKKEGKRLQALIDFAGELERLGSMDQAAAEIENRYAAAKKAGGELEGKIKALEAKVEEQKGLAEKIIASAKNDAAAIVKQGEAVSNEMRMKAKKESTDMMLQAKGAVERLALEKDQALAEVSVLKSAVAEEKEKLAALKKELSELKAKLG